MRQLGLRPPGNEHSVKLKKNTQKKWPVDKCLLDRDAILLVHRQRALLALGSMHCHLRTRFLRGTGTGTTRLGVDLMQIMSDMKRTPLKTEIYFVPGWIRTTDCVDTCSTSTDSTI